MAYSISSDPYATRYMPTSPLSPRLPGSQQPLSPQPTRHRPSGRQGPRNMHMTLPKYHPANFHHADSSTSASSSAVQSPAVTLNNRVNQPVTMESPRLMREKQREFLERARLSSKIAASSMGVKPEGPRLEPLGSPKGPVTPLELEEARDYFQVAGAGRISPAVSPGARSLRSNSPQDKKEEEGKRVLRADVY